MKSGKLELTVQGMMCQHCKNTVEKSIRAPDGIVEANVDLEGRRLDVDFDSELVSEDRIRETVEKGGEIEC